MTVRNEGTDGSSGFLPSDAVHAEFSRRPRAADAAQEDLSAVVVSNASRHRLTRNVLVNYITMAVMLLLGFSTTPLLIRFLGKESYGVWSILSNVVVYLGLLDLGLSTTVSRRVAEYAGRNEAERLRIALGTATLSFLAQGALVLLLTLFLIPGLDRLFAIPPEMLAPARWCLAILGLSVFARFCLNIYTIILVGAGRADLGSALSGVINVCFALCNVLLAAMGCGIIALGLNLLLLNIVLGLIARALAHRHLPGFHVMIGSASLAVAREMLPAGLRSITISLSGHLAYGSDVLIIGFLMPLSSVTYYTIAVKLVGFVRELACRPGTVFLPTFSLLYARGEQDRLFRLYTQSVTLSVALCLPFALAFGFMGDRIVFAWMGAGHELSATVLAWLGFWLTLALPGYVSLQIFTGTEKTLHVARLYPVSACLNVGLSVFLTRQIGLQGPAISSTCTALVIDFLLLPYLACRTFGFSYRGYWGALRSQLALLGAGIGLCLLTRWSGLPPSRLVTLAWMAGFLTLCWGAWLSLGLDARQRAVYLQPLYAKGARLLPFLRRT